MSESNTNKAQRDKARFVTKDEARARWLKHIEGQQDVRRNFRTGFKAHDQSVGSLLRGSLTVIAARPGVGKTSLLQSLAYRQERAGCHAYYASFEMSVESMWSRLACIHYTDLTLRQINEGELGEKDATR